MPTLIKLKDFTPAAASRARFTPGIGVDRLDKLLLNGSVETGIKWAGLPHELAEFVRVQNDAPAPQPVETDPVTTEAKPLPAAPASTDELAILRRLLGAPLDEGRVIELIKQHGAGPATVTLDVRTPEREIKFEGAVHHAFPKLLSAVSQRLNVLMVGPAGSGKTTAALRVAEVLGLPFEFTGSLSSEYKLTGFIDAQGRIVDSAFRRAFLNGGVFLFDEMDGSLPGAVLAFNAALANRRYDFPDGSFEAHPDFIAIAAANTFGNGASRQYVGRNQLDAATLDRFVTLDWGYDEAIEAAMLGLPRPGTAPLPQAIVPVTPERAGELAPQWLARVQAVRRAIDKLKVRHVVSPRASVAGAKLLACGWDWADVEASVIWKGLEPDTVNKVKEAC